MYSFYVFLEKSAISSVNEIYREGVTGAKKKKNQTAGKFLSGGRFFTFF
jgi:hypothetical protein